MSADGDGHPDGATVRTLTSTRRCGAGRSPCGGLARSRVVGEPYGRAVGILKSQGVKPSFGGSVGSDLPQAACIVDSQKVTSQGRMILMLNCTQKAADDATASQPAAGAAPGGPAPGAGQGTYGNPVGVPIAVG